MSAVICWTGSGGEVAPPTGAAVSTEATSSFDDRVDNGSVERVDGTTKASAVEEAAPAAARDSRRFGVMV